MQAEREEDPLCCYTEMEEQLSGAFPDVFLLGPTHKRKGPLKRGQVQHLLMQHTNVPATHAELQFFLFDVESRAMVSRNFAAKIRKDPHSFNCYAAMINDETFHAKIRKAAAEPDSEVAKEVMRCVLPVLTVGVHNNLLAGSLGDKTSMHRAIAQSKRHGGGCTFLTVTPDDINNLKSLRLAVNHSSVTAFPSFTDNNFYDAVHAGTSHEGETLKFSC